MSESLPLVDVIEEGNEMSFTAKARQDFTIVRDFLTEEMKEMDLPWEPLPTQSGYFLLTDISKCRDLIP